MNLSLWSVPLDGEKRLYGLVPSKDYRPEQRLMDDDPIWRDREMKFHWVQRYDERRYRCRPATRIKFWVA